MARKTTNTTKEKPRRTAPVKAKSTVVESAPTPSVIRQSKPLFGAGTWVTVLLLIALIGFTVYLNREKEKTGTGEATPIGETTTIFNMEDGVISSIEIKPADGEAVKVTRDEKNVWALELPIKTEANQGLVEAAATQVSALKVISQINADPEVFGLKNPAFTITIEFKGGAKDKHTLEVGDSTPTKSGYYVRVDKDKMMITDLSGIESLLQLLNSPPYLNTPVPTSEPVSPTEASTPTPAP